MAAMVTGELTRADLDAMPEDGRRYELIDGCIVVTPAPGLGHQRLVRALTRALDDALDGTYLEVIPAPYDVLLGRNVVEPDLVVAPSEAFRERDLATPPVLMVEVRSASTGWIDTGRKREIYESAGVASYWLVDPTGPSITVLELVDGRYREVGAATGEEVIDVARPVPMRLCLARLLPAARSG